MLLLVLCSLRVSILITEKVSLLLYFAFGSNMSERRLLERIKAEKLGVATLTEHRLCFHKVSEADGSAKCNILETGQPYDFVLGVLYEIDESQKPILDYIEGLGFGYDIKTVTVNLDGKSFETYTYYATSIDPSLKPYHWYKRHVLEGAIENGMPSDYIKSIEDVEALVDTDSERQDRESAIYR